MLNIHHTVSLDPKDRQLLQAQRASSDRLALAVESLNERIDGLIELLSPQSREGFVLTRVEDIDTHLVLEGDITAMQLTDTQKATITFGGPIDKKGKAARVTDVKIEVVDGISATVEPNPDDPTNQFSALIVAGDPTPDPSAPTAIRISGDADLGEGVKTIETFVPLLVTSGEAVGFGAPVEGTPVEQ
jgi:hypothetical protein